MDEYKMKLKMTLLVHDEEDIIRQNILYHFHMGTPGNSTHVREWNGKEFQQYVESHKLNIEDHCIVELEA